MKYFNTITQISVGQATDSLIFGESLRITLQDEGGGMFLVFCQSGADDKEHEIRVDFEEWDNICEAVLVLKNQSTVK